MSTAVIDNIGNKNKTKYMAVDLPVENDNDYDKDWAEALAESEDIIAHPEKYKFYNSARELLEAIGVM